MVINWTGVNNLLIDYSTSTQVGAEIIGACYLVRSVLRGHTVPADAAEE